MVGYGLTFIRTNPLILVWILLQDMDIRIPCIIKQSMMQIIYVTYRHMNPKRVRHMDIDEKGKHREKKSDKNVLFNQHYTASNINSAFICFLMV